MGDIPSSRYLAIKTGKLKEKIEQEEGRQIDVQKDYIEQS